MKARAKKALFRFGASTVIVGGTLAAFPALAFASETAGISAVLPDMAEFIPMLVCFILLCVLLGKLGWPKFAAMLDKREQTIKESLEKSETARVEGEKLLAEYKQQLDEAKAQAAHIVATAKETGEAVKADITDKAQKEAAAMIEKAKVAIEVEKRAAIAELQGSAADTAISVASRVIGSDLNDAEHRAIVERYVNEAGSFNAN